MYPALNIGSFVLPTAGLIYILGAWFALSAVERAANAIEQDGDKVYGLAATAIFAGILGARLSFVFIYWPAFQENLLGIVWPLNTGYHAWGGLIVAVAAGTFYVRARRLSVLPALDSLAPGLILGMMVISLADFVAGPGFGTLSNLPWAVSLFSVRRHPVQIYEIAAALLALVTWWRGASQSRRKPGRLFLMTLAVYGSGRLLADGFHANAWVLESGYHGTQIIALLLVLFSLYFLGRSADNEAASS